MKKVFKNKKVLILILLLLITTVSAPYTFSRYFSSFHKKIILNVREPAYSIVFNSNSGTGIMQTQSFVYGTAQRLYANTFTKSGFSFKEWNTKADGTGTSYSNEEEINNLSNVDGDEIILYAQWMSPYNVTYEGVSSASLPSTVNSGESLVVNFGSTSYSIDSITMNNVAISSSAYTFVNNVLTVPNVTGNVHIKVSNATPVDYYILDNTDTVPLDTLSITNASTLPVPMADYLSMSFRGVSSSSKIIKQIDVTFSYTTPTGSAQATNLILTDPQGVDHTITVNWIAKQKKQTSITVSFTGLNIGLNESFTIKASNNSHTNSNINIYSQTIKTVFDS